MTCSVCHPCGAHTLCGASVTTAELFDEHQTSERLLENSDETVADLQWLEQAAFSGWEKRFQ